MIAESTKGFILMWLGVIAAAFATVSLALHLPGVAAFVVLCCGVLLMARTMVKLSLWQNIVVVSLTGLLVLSYGFANLAVDVVVAVPVAHLLMFSALILALRRRLHTLKPLLQEPTCWCLAGLFLLTSIHLTMEIPRYGLYALRDANFVLESVFLLLGYLWAVRRKAAESWVEVFSGLFILHLAYVLTYPVLSDFLKGISPVSGIFLDVPLLGYYSHLSLVLLYGAFFYVLLEDHLPSWPWFVLGALVLVQGAWLVINQSRAMYIGILVALVFLVLVRAGKHALRLALRVGLGIIILFGCISLFSVELKGRVVLVTPPSVAQHAMGLAIILGKDPTEAVSTDSSEEAGEVSQQPLGPGEGTVTWRVQRFKEAWQRWKASPVTRLIGEGFGLPLTDHNLGGGVVVRQPHNTHLTVLARLGVVGLVLWIVMHGRIACLFLRTILRRSASGVEHRLILWLSVCYVLGMVFTTFQPWLEFSYGAIPFYVFLGFALGLMRPQGSTGA
jgi:hypothetical protein